MFCGFQSSQSIPKIRSLLVATVLLVLVLVLGLGLV